MDTYILKGKEAVKVNMTVFGAWFEHANRRVADTKKGDIRVSTVFLGLDHTYYEEGSPLLFETMIIGGDHDQEICRYTTWEEAEKGHKEACKVAFK